MRPTLLNNTKFKRLCLELKLPRAQVIGHLELLWSVAHESGVPVFRTAKDVEAAAEWAGDSGLFSSSMLEIGLIDSIDSGFELHDYWEHAPEYVQKRRTRELERKVKAAKLRDSADNGRQRQTTAENGVPPTPTPTPTLRDSCGEAVPPSPPEPAAGEVFVRGNGPYTIDDEDVGMWFPVVGGKDARGWPLTKAHAKQLRASFKAKFPDAEVMRLEFEKARSWLINNPQRRKTPGGMPAFLNNWIGKTR